MTPVPKSVKKWNLSDDEEDDDADADDEGGDGEAPCKPKNGAKNGPPAKKEESEEEVCLSA